MTARVADRTPATGRTLNVVGSDRNESRRTSTHHLTTPISPRRVIPSYL